LVYPVRSLRIRNYRYYFAGQVISASGTWMQSFALGWLVLDMARQGAVALGSVVALQFVPVLLLSPVGGLVADRVARRKVILATQSLAGMQALALGLLVLVHSASLGLVLLFSALLGCISAFDVPARQAFVEEMVGKEVLSNAVALNSVVMNLARVIGPGIGGVVVATAGPGVCFILNAASYAAMVVALVLVRPEELRRVDRKSPNASFREGIQYVARRRGLAVPLAMLLLVGTLAYNFQVLLLLLARDGFHLRADAAGTLFTAMGAGSVLGGLVAASRHSPSDALLVSSCLAFGVATLGTALSPSYATALASIFLTGVFSIIYLATTNSTLQLRSPLSVRGRVMSLYVLGFLGTTPVGSLVAAGIAAGFGVRAALAVGGAAAVLAAGVGYFGLFGRRGSRERAMAPEASPREAEEAAGGVFAPEAQHP
jgi:MFS family permease